MADWDVWAGVQEYIPRLWLRYVSWEFRARRTGTMQSVPGTLAVEIPLFAIGIIVYVRSTSAKTVAGYISFWSFVEFVTAIYLTVIGNPPPNENFLALMSLSGWLLVLWGYWIESGRLKR